MPSDHEAVGSKLEDVSATEDNEGTYFTEDDVEDLEEDLEEGTDARRAVEPSELSLEARPAAPRPHLEVDDARWPDDPADAPDTWHLPPQFQDSEFDLTLSVVNRLLEAGRFEPNLSTNGRFVISLRGCETVDGSSSVTDQSSVRLRATKPDHENFRCLIGVVDTQEELISLYIASTVPRRTGMLRFYDRENFGKRARKCNMLPTGCYEHCVGTHGGTKGDIVFVLRLGNGPTKANAGRALVWRTVNDLIYDTSDDPNNTKPADNIHPALLAESFSSLGCLTVRGTQTPNGSFTTGKREWRKFRKKLGFDGENHGKRFDNLLVTGHEAAAAALTDSSGRSALVCLRQGSRGELVGRLQSQLEIDVDNVFGPKTCEKLVALQRSKLNFATGTWSERMAQELGLQF